MLLPRFTLRLVLVAFVVAALLSLIASWAIEGSPWAIGVTVGVLSLLTAAMAYVVTFALCTVMAGLLGTEEVVARTSQGGLQQSAAVPTPIQQDAELSEAGSTREGLGREEPSS